MGRIHDALKRAEEERARIRAPEVPSRLELAPEPERAEPPAAPAPTGPAAVAPTELPAAQAPAPIPAPAEPAPQEAALVGRIRLPELEPAIEDEYKSLRARIQSLRRQRPIRSLVVTSARPGEGKTTTALHLARSYGLDRELLTCLVDLDLRSPDVHKAISARPSLGTADLLQGKATLDQVLVRVADSGLFVVPAGHVPENPSELLESMRMAQLVNELHARFGMVILDSPPVLGLPDGTEIVDQFDAVLLVVAASATTARDIDEVLERIDSEKLIGTVLNRCPEGALQYRYGYYGGREAEA